MLSHHTFTPEGATYTPRVFHVKRCPIQKPQYDTTMAPCNKDCALYDTEHDCCSLKGNPAKVAAVQKARRVAGKP